MKRITPVKMLSLMTILIGIFDHVSNPIEHKGSAGLFQTNIFLESSIRFIFIFCGIFGLIGNGKSARIRATISALPLVYLASYYTILYIQNGLNVLIIPIILSWGVSLWTILLGAKYE